MSTTKEKEAQPKTEQQKAKDFFNAYGELCIKHGYQIIVSPAWKYSHDNNDFRLVLQESVGKLPVKQMN